MGIIPLWLLGLGALWLATNCLATWRLSRSQMFEPSQKRLQSLLIWVVPGFAIVVLALTSSKLEAVIEEDATVSKVGVNSVIDSSGGGPGHPHGPTDASHG